jgi:hypothetical protein
LYSFVWLDREFAFQILQQQQQQQQQQQ